MFVFKFELFPITRHKLELLEQTRDNMTLCKHLKEYFVNFQDIYEAYDDPKAGDCIWILHDDASAVERRAYPRLTHALAMAYCEVDAGQTKIALLCATERGPKGVGKRLFDAICADAAARGLTYLTLLAVLDRVDMYVTRYGMTCDMSDCTIALPRPGLISQRVPNDASVAFDMFIAPETAGGSRRPRRSLASRKSRRSLASRKSRRRAHRKRS